MIAARCTLLAIATLVACGGSHAPPSAPPAPRHVAPPPPPPPPPPRPDTGISLQVTPADADVAIDDEAPQPASALPDVVGLKPGIHQLVVTKDGYKAYRVEFSVVSGKTETFSVRLEPARP